MSGDVARGPGWELRCGRWQDVLADVTECQAVISDPPYGARTHAWQRTSKAPRGGRKSMCSINYAPIGRREQREFADFAVGLSPGWILLFSDHQLQRGWEAVLVARGQYVFAPVPWFRENPTPRMSGDGPTSAVEYITVARQKRRGHMPGSLPGFYFGPVEKVGHPGAKPTWLVRALVRHYTKPGDLIVDPFAGSGTTLLAAVLEGRRAIGAEMDPVTFALAVRRLEERAGEPTEVHKMKQRKLL